MRHRLVLATILSLLVRVPGLKVGVKNTMPNRSRYSRRCEY